MACVGISVVLPTLDIPGLEVGIGLPSIALDADLCCKIQIGPIPNIPPLNIPLPIPTSIFAAVNATMELFQIYLDELVLAVDCPLD